MNVVYHNNNKSIERNLHEKKTFLCDIRYKKNMHTIILLLITVNMDYPQHHLISLSRINSLILTTSTQLSTSQLSFHSYFVPHIFLTNVSLRGLK